MKTAQIKFICVFDGHYSDPVLDSEICLLMRSFKQKSQLQNNRVYRKSMRLG